LSTAYCLLPTFSKAQNFEQKNYDWQVNPTSYSLSAWEQKESYIILKDKTIIEYIFDENDNLVVYETKHKIVKVNDDRAIESFNKVYIGISDVLDILNIKARSVTKQGKVTEVDKSNIKEIENLENYGSYKIFAIEGIEKGSEVEYLYTLKKLVSWFGTVTFQTKAIVHNAELDIISPENIIFIAKGYNHCPPLTDTIINSKRYIKVAIDSIPALEEEKYAAWYANLMRVEFKFSHNTNTGNAELLTWTNAAKNHYAMVYESDKKTKKKLLKILNALGLKGLSEEEKIKKIENYVKTNYVQKNIAGYEFENIGDIINNKSANNRGILKLLAMLYKVQNIDHHLVLACNRFNTRFDKDFMSWNYLNYYLLYFPNQDKFLAPTQPSYRYGLIPYEWAFNDGLFISPITIGDYSAVIGVVQNISGTDIDYNYDNLEIFIYFNDDLSIANIHLKRFMGGHTAMPIQPYYDYLPATNKSEIIQALVNLSNEDAQLTDVKVKNHNINISPLEKPFIVEGNISVTTYLEKAGENYLFSIGKVIGEQVEMYQEKKRQNDVELNYPHKYLRDITFNIPDDYEVRGLEKLRFNIAFGEEEDKPSMGFISDYTINGTQIKLTINEFYKQISYPVEQFEDFRKVINAAADFNKVVLVLEKR